MEDKVIAMARELGKVIQQDERFLRIDASKKANDEDKDLQKQIIDFNMKRSELSTALAQDEKDSDKLTALDKELKEMYQAIMENPNMVEFNAAKHEVDHMMSFITDILFGAINGEDPDTVEMRAGCSGDCGGCSGCH